MPFPTRAVKDREDIPDVFQDNAQNILQKTSVSNMIGLLQQLNKISVYASEIFEDVLRITQEKNVRIQQCKTRLRNIESRVPATEQMFINNAPSYFYDNPFTGKEWQRKDPVNGLLFRRERASKFVNRRREDAFPLPDLSPLDQISASGPCIKKFSDSNFFMNEWLEAEKRKMEEEKAKRKQKKKDKRKKKKRQQTEKIQAIRKDKFDKNTGQKIKAEQSEVLTKQYTLTDDVNTKTDFESVDSSKYSSRMTGFHQINNQKLEEKKKKKQHKHKPAAAAAAPGMNAVPMAANDNGPSEAPGPVPPPNPMKMVQPGGGGSGGGGGGEGGPGGAPPPVPMDARPPPNPMMMQQPPKQKLTGAQMAMRSAQTAQTSQMYAAPAQIKPPPKSLQHMKSNALLAGIRSKNVKLKQAPKVKREAPKDQRSVLMDALRAKKGGKGLKHVAEEQKNVKKEEEVDSTIYAILNRRKYMADDSDSDTGGSSSGWSSSE